MFSKAVAVCPVCDTTLGYRIKGEVCSFVCRECQYIFTWDRKGNLTAPLKVDGKRKDICTCASCKYRDEQSLKR